MKTDVENVANLIDAIAQRPGIYVGRVSLTAISHYLNGYVHALHSLGHEDLLDAWQRWVDLRFGIHHAAWGWTRILLHVYGTDEAAIQALPALYREYMRARTDLGTEGIEQQLREMLLARYGRDWFKPEQTHTRSLGEGPPDDDG